MKFKRYTEKTIVGYRTLKITRFYLILGGLASISILFLSCANPLGGSNADSNFHPGVPGTQSITAFTSNECPTTPSGTLNLSLGSPMVNGAPATSCSISAMSASLQGTPICVCSAGVCTLSGLTLTAAFLTAMTPGVSANISSAITYGVTSSAGSSSTAASLTVNTGTWSPTCLASTLTMWLDASVATSLFNDSAGTIPIANGLGAGLWEDLSGNGYNATATVKPVYSSAAKSLTFNGTTTLMTSTLTAGIFNGTVGTMVAMVSPSAAQTTDTGILNFRFAGGNNTGLIYFNTTTYGWDWGVSNAYMWNSGLVPTLSQFDVVTLVNSSVSTLMSLNGTTNSTATYAGASSNNNPAIPLIIGDDTGVGGRFYNGQMSELLISTTNVSASVRQQIEGYLAWKWGTQSHLIVTHPYYSAAP
jgi:hypothetical protein